MRMLGQRSRTMITTQLKSLLPGPLTTLSHYQGQKIPILRVFTSLINCSSGVFCVESKPGVYASDSRTSES
jgi:hypothetical protein